MRTLRAHFLLAAGCAVLGFATPGRAAPDCRATLATTVPLDESADLTVHAEVDGTPVRFIVDTGAQRSVLDVETVRRLGIALDPWVASTMRGIGGDERRRNALPRAIVLGGVALRPRDLSGHLSIPVAHLPAGQTDGTRGEPIGGLLGTDLLAGFDLVLDGPAGRLALYDVRGCSARFVPPRTPPWNGPFTTLPAIRPVRDMLLVPVRIDGRVLLAEIDSGAATTLVLAPGLLRLGLTEAMLAGDPTAIMRGLGPDDSVSHRHRFATLAIGDEIIRDPALWVGNARSLLIVDLLLGADWLRARTVWLSYATIQVFVGPAAPGPR
jgi:hypothetical protein